MNEEYRIAIVDDHPLMRSGVVRTLQKEPQFIVVGEGESKDDAIRIAEEELPDVILLDVSMPGGGLEAARIIAERCPAVKIVFLTVAESEDTISAALRAGARGYILKGVRGTDFITTLLSVATGDAVVLPGLASRLLAGGGPEKSRPNGPAKDLLSDLTAREREILRHLAQGKSNRDIGELIGISERTVKHYMHNILQKLHVRNRVEAALLAEREWQKAD